MNRQFWFGLGFQGRMFALPAGQLRQGGGTALHRFACRSFPPRSSTTAGGARFFSFPTSHLSSVREIVFTRKTGIASRRRRGQGGNVLCWFVLRFVLGVFSIVCALLSSAPFFRLRLWRTAFQGRGRQGGLWDGCSVPWGFSELGWTSVRVLGFHCLILP